MKVPPAFSQSYLAWIPLLIANLLLMTATAQSDETGVNCANPQYQQEMNFCAFKDFEAADKELNLVWNKTMAWVKGFGTGLPAQYQGGPDKLLAAQRLWIKFRDAHCESDAHSSIGGTIYPLLYHSCRANLTRARTQQLRDIAQEG